MTIIESSGASIAAVVRLAILALEYAGIAVILVGAVAARARCKAVSCHGQ